MKIKRVFPQKTSTIQRNILLKMKNKFSKIKIVKFRKNKTCFSTKTSTIQRNILSKITK